jgi:hypothetical protein
MKKTIFAFILLLSIFTLTACTDDSDPCGDGTELVDGVCVLVDDTNNPNPNLGAFDCSNETGLHSVAGGKPYTISEWLNWKFIGGHLVSDPDNAWIQDFGAAVFNVIQVAPEPWQGSFTQSKMFLTEGCEYTFEFTLRTEGPNLKPDVIVFGENTSGVSFFEETVDLETNSKTYSYTVIPTSSYWVSAGVYFANSTGMVIIEEVQIQRNPIGTNSN